MGKYFCTYVYTKEEWEAANSSNYYLPLDEALYEQMRRKISIQMFADEFFNPTWRYHYGGHCDIDTHLCLLTLSYQPDLEKNYIIKQAAYAI